MAQQPRVRDAESVESTLTSGLVVPEGPRWRSRHCGLVAVRSRQGRLGLLEAALDGQRLLLLRAPQVRGGALPIPFEAIERVDTERREILLRSAREALSLAARLPEGRDGG